MRGLQDLAELQGGDMRRMGPSQREEGLVRQLLAGGLVRLTSG